jgi:hypothetical protein
MAPLFSACPQMVGFFRFFHDFHGGSYVVGCAKTFQLPGDEALWAKLAARQVKAQ